MSYAWLSWVELGQVKLRWVKLGQVKLGQAVNCVKKKFYKNILTTDSNFGTFKKEEKR